MPHTAGGHAPKPRGARAPARRTARTLLAAAVMAALVAAATPPAGGQRDIGDPLFPGLGNPGYDVAAYDIAFDYHGNDRPLDAVTTIDARATERLATLNLDFSHGTVRSVDVGGSPARFASAGEDLVVTPARPVERGEHLRVTVRHTSDPRGGAGGGWVRTRDGLAMANQADVAHHVFPCNDHPSDKAFFTFHITAPKALTAVANGLPAGRTSRGADTTWTYVSAHPIATELTQVSIGRSAVLHRTGTHGLPVRDVVPAADRDRFGKRLARTVKQLAWLEGKVGRYPFETYGLLIADASTGFELETQTLSLFERRLFTETAAYPVWYVDSLMVHELAHQWFGDSVSPRRWSDVWLNESHATWYEALYAQETAKKPLTERMRAAYARSDAWRAAGGPPAAPKASAPGKKISIFRPVVYDGSALVLYALRQEIGAPAFARLERAWVALHRDSTASTADFTALASQVAGRDLGGFLHPWLYGQKTPPMPGHPDWKAARKPA
ncbi:M1 family metallopeptidase [Streptomyces varsoviensis]|uniref:Aminopeptidase N n=1 Tax=Streptomyces varsoviensis TaxID=67373 RepID=A0ABR5JDG2_9ACTN|nr:zinc metalloprotease [Streptomyces varsoviensis]